MRLLFADCRGSFATTFAMILPALIGFAALGVEVANLFRQERYLELAADAAVISAMSGSKSIDARRNDAQVIVAAYGLNATDSSFFKFNMPPLSGHYSGDNQAGEVVLQYTRGPGLLGLFRSANITVSGRAVAKRAIQSFGCVLLLERTAANTLTLNNGASITNNDCEMVVNSAASESIYLWNNATIYGPVYTVGNYWLATSARLLGDPVTTSGDITTDPYASMSLPQKPPCTNQSNSFSGRNNIFINPGAFCAGITIANNSAVTFRPGTYFIDSFFRVGQNSDVSATDGVTIIFQPTVTNINLANGSTLNLVAPRSGTTPGLALIGNVPGDITVTLENGATMQVVGALYMPTAHVTFLGNANTGNSPCTQLVAKRLTISGALNFRGQCDNVGTQPIGRTRPKLIE